MASKSMPAILNFSGGEVDGYALARVDLDVSPHTAEIMENVSLITQGAMELFPGTLFIDNTPGNAVVKLRPWVSSQRAAFAVEYSAGLIRLIYDGGYVTLDGAAATVGLFSDESTAPPAGGDPPPPEGGGDGWTSPVDEGTCIYESELGMWICY